MFYLLEEDNRIIYDEEILNEYKKRGNFSNLKTKINKNELQLIYINDRDISCIVHIVGKIKKQSENVYDLIDREKDLVEIEGQIIMAKHISGDISKMSGISAIYKPDANGNYIKVWEKK